MPVKIVDNSTYKFVKQNTECYRNNKIYKSKYNHTFLFDAKIERKN